jgi:spore coat polysaccharide biosynthesis protein SpsF
MSVLCVIQARTGSSRLPGKVLADLGGRPMLRYMLDRLSALGVDDLVVATTTLDRDTPVATVAREAGRPVVRGSEDDVLGRFIAALDEHPADTVIRLTADCPLVDPGLVADVLSLHQTRGADYTCNVLPRTFPKGLDVEVMSAPALEDAGAEARSPAEREHVTPFLYRHPERFKLANLRSGQDLGEERWTVDTADDLAFVRSVATAFGDRTDFGWREVLAAVGPTARPAPGRLHLRPAQATDADALLRWRNDPDAVRQSASGLTVEHEEHRQWLAERLEDPGTRIWIAEVDGTPVGMVRVDVTNAVGTVSIAVDQGTRGRGLGTAILRGLVERLEGDFQVETLEAFARPSNVASVRAFEGAGFRPSGDSGTFTVLRWAKMDGPQRESAS